MKKEMRKVAKAAHKKAWFARADKLESPGELFSFLKSATQLNIKLPAQMTNREGESVYGANRIETLASFYGDPSKPSWKFDERFRVEIETQVEQFLAVSYAELPVGGGRLSDPFSLPEIQNQLASLVSGKSAGPDEVFPYMLKWAPPRVC